MSAKPFLIYCTGLYIIRPGGIQGQQGHTWPRLDIPVSNTKTRTCVFLMANTGKLQDLSLLHWPGMGSIWDLSPLQGRGQYYTKTWSQVPVLPQAYLRQNHWGGAFFFYRLTIFFTISQFFLPPRCLCRMSESGALEVQDSEYVANTSSLYVIKTCNRFFSGHERL